MSKRTHVQVLVATYNGEQYIGMQLDSILAQTGVDVTILISDDGSTDGTRAMLDAYLESYPDKITVLPAKAGTGHPKLNFLRLLAASDAGYVALSDQDDVWSPQKLADSVAAMHILEQQHGCDLPLLVFSDLEVVDSQLHTIHPSFWKHQHIAPERIHRLSNILAQNVLTGCTSLMNRSLVEKTAAMPLAAFMHDWWIALLVASFGHAHVLRQPTVRYRQHASNAVGAVLVQHRRLLPQLRAHGLRRMQWEMSEQQAEAFLAVYRYELATDKLEILQAYLRCEHSPNRLVRAWTYLRYGFFQKGLRPNLAMLWYLWDMKAAKRLTASHTGAGGA